MVSHALECDGRHAGAASREGPQQSRRAVLPRTDKVREEDASTDDHRGGEAELADRGWVDPGCLHDHGHRPIEGD
eukprot:5232904-Prymnesium_polylepis.1